MIRWPRDALIFSARVAEHACYAAGYVEGSTVFTELLGAKPGADGAELVVFRMMNMSSDERIMAVRGAHLDADRAIAAAGNPGVAKILDVFTTYDAVQPDGFDRSIGGQNKIVIVEELPGNVNAYDLERRLFTGSARGGRPPIGLALYVVRRVIAALGPLPAEADGFHLRRHPTNVLLSWEGEVRVQPHAATLDSHDDVFESGELLRSLLVGPRPSPYWRGDSLYHPPLPQLRDLRSDAPTWLVDLVRESLDPASSLTLAQMAEALDVGQGDEPFAAEDLAGLLAQFFPSDRADDLTFREELAACDLDALDIPQITRAPVALGAYRPNQ